MTDNISRDEIIAALRTMTDTEARATFAEARGADAASKQQRAADAVREHLRGLTINTKE